MSNKNSGIAYGNINEIQSRLWVSGVKTTQDSAYDTGAIVPDLDHPDKLRRPSSEEMSLFLATRTTPRSGYIEVIGFTENLRQLMNDDSELRLGNTNSKPDQLTTTVNKKTGNLVGLHIDERPELPESDTADYSIRLGFNFGPGSRYLLVTSVDAKDLTDIYGGNNPGYVRLPIY